MDYFFEFGGLEKYRQRLIEKDFIQIISENVKDRELGDYPTNCP